MTMEVKRGDVFLVNFGAAYGSVQGGLRPAVVVQNNVGNLHSPTVTVLPITSMTKKRHLPTHVLLEQGVAGLRMESMILTEQICTISKSQMNARIGTVSTVIQTRISNAIRIQLDI